MRQVIVSVLSLLAASSCAHAAAVSSYPYRAELLAFSPVRGEFPVVNAITPGYVRYLDQQGLEHLVGYKYPEPVQSRRITNEEYLNQLIKGSLNKDDAENSMAREEHFRLWSMQQYDQYRQETERLKAIGQEPTADMLAKIRTLEAMIISSRSGAILENPLTKQVREEHLQLWNAARLAASQLEAGKTTQQQDGSAETAFKPTIYLRFQSAELAKDTPTQKAIVGETAEQKKAREEHLRNYQEQLQRVQKLQAEAGKTSDSHVHLPKEARFAYQASDGANQNRQQIEGVKIVEHLSYLQETPEVQRAKAEHLRLWNEAKLRAAKEGYKHDNRQYQSELLQTTDGQYDIKPERGIGQHKLPQMKPLSSKLDTQSSEQQRELQLAIASKTPMPVQDTPEVQRAKAEHLRILAELQKKTEFIADAQPDSNIQLYAPAANVQLAATKSTSDASGHQSQPQAYAAVQDTAEVQRAREEHLKLVKEAHLKANEYQKQSTQITLVPKPTLYAATELEKPGDQQLLTDEEERLRAEEVKQRESEILAEAERIKEEERLKAEELLRLQQEEQRRQEQERLDQAIENKAAERYAETPQLPTLEQPKATLEQLIQTQIKTADDAAVTYDIREKEKYATNPYLLRFATPSANQLGASIATTSYYLGAQQSGLQPHQHYGNPGYYYLRDGSENYIKLDNPYFLHYITNKQGGKETLATTDTASLANALAALNQVQKIEQPLPAAIAEQPVSAPIIPIAPIVPITAAAPKLPYAPITSTAATMKINYGSDPSLSALEKATRDHFRAHEIALEQLRLANQKQLAAQKDCY